MRYCLNCGQPFEPHRRDAQCCSGACRAEKSRRQKAGTWSPHPSYPHRSAQNASRRPSRDGRGVRIYLTPEDFNELGDLRVHDPAVARKLDRAFERLLGRAA